SSTPSKPPRAQPSEQQAESVRGPSNDSSSDSSLSFLNPVEAPETSEKPKSKFNLKAIFAYHFRGKKFKAAAHQKFRCRSGKKRKRTQKPPCKFTQLQIRRPPLSISPQEQKRRLQHRGFEFPFVEKYYGKKHIPLNMVLRYEQAAIKGYLQYVEVLKCEEHLAEALKTLEANEDLEKECLVVRKHKYLDDEGPISPIPEM
ncbi:TAF1D polymerase, partial [Centropus bengalensis]|nr:TAF1D polymerase [Centropus bengalensis]